MKIVISISLASVCAFGAPSVTSQEQFKRLKEGGLPKNLRYNFERAYLEVQSSGNCPSHSRAFYFLHIGKEGDVETVRGHLVALSADLRSVALEWGKALLKQIHFRPLIYDNKPTSVDTALTMVCAE
jgi:hypothetical protein